MPGMPTMHDHPTGSTWNSLVVLTLLCLFWTGTVLHLVRLVAGPLVAGRDPAADAAHAAMGATMAYMLFPGAWTGPNHIAAGAFAAGAAAFAIRALKPRNAADAPARRAHAAVIAVTGAAMAAMLGLRTPTSTLVGGLAAVLLVGCAAAHARILTHRHLHHRMPHGLDRNQVRLLITAPGVAGVATTLGMAYMVTAM